MDVLTDMYRKRATKSAVDNSNPSMTISHSSRERLKSDQRQKTRNIARRQSSHINNSDSDSDTESTDNSDSNDESEKTDETISGPVHKTQKLPNFTGKENWKAWITRFEDIARRQRWTINQKLDQIIPCLQGQAGEFVFCKLSERVRGNYKILIEEHNNKYREIETTKTYAAKFARRNQIPGKSVRDYAAELKKLYGKEHYNRSPESRQEDLLRKFFDGPLNS